MLGVQHLCFSARRRQVDAETELLAPSLSQSSRCSASNTIDLHRSRLLRSPRALEEEELTSQPLSRVSCQGALRLPRCGCGCLCLFDDVLANVTVPLSGRQEYDWLKTCKRRPDLRRNSLELSSESELYRLVVNGTSRCQLCSCTAQ